LPQAIVRVEVAIGVAHALQVLMQHVEVLRFLKRHTQPVFIKRIGHAVETPYCIER
jgi:hypothetical protein